MKRVGWGGKKERKKKAEGHVGGERGSRQHLQSPLLIARLPAWSQITGLETPQSGLYLLANLPAPQIHTSKPPSYHLLVHLLRRKRTPRYCEVRTPSLCPSLSLASCRRERSRRFATPTTQHVFFSLFPGLERFRAMFPPLPFLSSSLRVGALM